MILKILFPVIVILAALMDGYQHSNRKLTGSFFKTLFLFAIAYGFYLCASFYSILYLFLCWVLLFDVVYNITRGELILYVGKTKWTDRLLRWLCDTNRATRGHYTHVSLLIKLVAAAGIFALYYIKLI